MGVPYLGKYVGHDNNRDINLALVQMRALTDWFYTAHPPIMHDLHESMALMYTYSGGPPQNPNLDPLLFAELPWFSNWEMAQMTKWGMPGVYTHAFMDGWSPGYYASVAYNHNALMKMYRDAVRARPRGGARCAGSAGRSAGRRDAGRRSGRGATRRNACGGNARRSARRSRAWRSACRRAARRTGRGPARGRAARGDARRRPRRCGAGPDRPRRRTGSRVVSRPPGAAERGRLASAAAPTSTTCRPA